MANNFITSDPRRRALFDQIASAILPPSTDTPPSTPVNPTLTPPTRVPGSEILAPAPEGSATPSPSEPVRIGLGTKGLIGVDKALADLDARREADRSYGTGITSTPDFAEINPPTPAHKAGLGERLKHLTRDFVLQGGEYARTHPGASTAELLTAGATGGGISAASPRTGDAMFRQAQIGEAERDVGRQLGIEKERAQVDALRTQPWYKQAQIALGQQRTDQGQQRIDQREDQYGRRLDQHDVEIGIKQRTAQNNEPVEIEVAGKKYRVRPDVAARITATADENEKSRILHESEGRANRANHITVAKIAAAAADSRLSRQLAVEIGKLGDPDEIADTATEIRKQARAKRDAANGTKDYAQKQSLNREAERLEKAATDLDTQGLKARGARGGAGTKAPTVAPPVEVKPKNLGMSRARFRKDNPSLRGKSDREIDEIISGEGYVPLP